MVEEEITEISKGVFDEYSMIPYPDEEAVLTEAKKLKTVMRETQNKDVEFDVDTQKIIEQIAKSFEIKMKMQNTEWVSGELQAPRP